MTAFRDRSWGSRVTALGDEAEGKFAEWAEEYGFGFAPYGLSRPPIQVHKVPVFIRYTPDFITTKYLYEVQGHGREGITKIKYDKLAAMLDWHEYMPVRMFLWNSHRKVRFDVPIVEYNAILNSDLGVHGAFEDGAKPWVGVSDEHLVDYIV